MLSYRHAFHAGNHADVLKHLVLVEVCQYMTQKESPFWVIDTHAGAGLYNLEAGYAAKLAEYRAGIGRLWGRDDLPPALEAYVSLVRALNPGGKLTRYPGSPWLAWKLLRPADRLKLHELHPSDFRQLADCFKHAGRQVAVSGQDGFSGLKALLPPPPRRAVALIDPAYETRHDYRRLLEAMGDALQRFPTGVYVIWYPRLARSEARQLPEKLKKLPVENWLHAALWVGNPAADGLGMTGSGLFIVNPPWTLEATLADTLPWLAKALAQEGSTGRYTLESRNDR